MPLSRLPKLGFYLTALFAFLGFADAAYLTVSHYFAVPLPCSLTDGCDTVLASAYSMIGPVPVAALGVAYYLLALVLAIYLYTSENPKTSTARYIQLLSGIGVLFSAYFLYLQIAVIGALCMYCLISATTSVLLFASSSFLAWQMVRHGKAGTGPMAAAGPEAQI
jgi:uncharacterized membrane protein